MKTKAELLIKALRHLSHDQKGKVATATIIEAADLLHELNRQVMDHELVMSNLEDIVTSDIKTHRDKVLDIGYILRREKT